MKKIFFTCWGSGTHYGGEGGVGERSKNGKTCGRHYWIILGSARVNKILRPLLTLKCKWQVGSLEFRAPNLKTYILFALYFPFQFLIKIILIPSLKSDPTVRTIQYRF